MDDTYRFRTLGPFRIPFDRETRTIDTNKARDSVFTAAEAEAQTRGIRDLKSAIGCYVFGLSPSGNARTWPYYVGQACSQTLYDRVFQRTDKPALYNDIMQAYARAAPFVYLLPLLTPTGRLARLKSNASMIDNAEHRLIGLALAANYELWNVQHRVAMERFEIDGTPGSLRRDTKSANAMRQMLNLEKWRDRLKPPRPTTGGLQVPDAPRDLVDPLGEAASAT